MEAASLRAARRAAGDSQGCLLEGCAVVFHAEDDALGAELHAAQCSSAGAGVLWLTDDRPGVCALDDCAAEAAPDERVLPRVSHLI